MTRQTINPEKLHKVIGCYSQVSTVGGMVATAGMAALDRHGRLVGAGDIGAQTRQTVENMLAALAAAGAGPDDILRVTVYLSDFSHYEGMNDAYRDFFPDNPPARATVRADLVDPDMLVEMEAIAVLERLPE